jgi:integrase
MPVLSRNHRQIMAATAIDGKRTRYRIDGVPGLRLDVSPTGKRFWYVRYQPGGRLGRRFRYFKIGDAAAVGLQAATRAAHDVINAVHVERRDPHAERLHRRNEALTFGDLFREWYERHALPNLVRSDADEIVYRLHIEKELGRRVVTELKRIELGRFRDLVAKRATPHVSDTALVLINRVLNWSLDEGFIEANPAARLRKVGKRRPRERVLTRAEIIAFWQALAATETMTDAHIKRGEPGRMLSAPTRSILRLLLLTGQRRGEVTAIRKAELDLDGPLPVWTIPGNRTKNRLLHRVPLCPLAAEEISKALAVSPQASPFLFPSPEVPDKEHVSFNAVTRAMARLTAEMGIEGVSPHDLRRTVGTGMASLGLPTHVRALVLNHSPQARGVTDAVYNRYAYDREKREALAAWEAYLSEVLAIATPQRAEIVQSELVAEDPLAYAEPALVSLPG